MPDSATTTMRADALPAELVALLPHGLPPTARVRVTLEVQEPTQEEWMEAVRAGIDRGRADAAAGRIVDVDDMFARLKSKHFPKLEQQP